MKIILLFAIIVCANYLFNRCIFFCWASAVQQDNYERNYTINVDGNTEQFSSKKILSGLKLSSVQKKISYKSEMRKITAQKLKDMGLSESEIVNYILPETETILDVLDKKYAFYPEKSYVTVIKNTCKLEVKNGKKGRYIDTVDFYKKVYNYILNGENNIKIDLKLRFFDENQDISSVFCERGYFETDCSSSSPSRKNNIAVALRAFDGLILEVGETLSFNKTTGERNEKSGYKEAKIISNGTFISGYGGGVCQVSTTIYNACLLSGIEVDEVHNHSLPVSYVEPGFDAMVNVGSSDLVVKNTTGSRLIFTTCFDGNRCKVKIFGAKNDYKIVRVSKKLETIPASEDIIETDLEKYNITDLSDGEERRISYPKDGFFADGFLKFFDKNGNYLKTERIRHVKYNPTRGIIVRKIRDDKIQN